MRVLIGKGHFSKAYLIEENVVELISRCSTKECYVLFSSGNPLAPIIERTYVDDNLSEGFLSYKMPLYPKVRAPKKQLNQKSYKLYQELRKLSNSYFSGYHEFCFLVSSISIDEEDKENVMSLAGDVCNTVDCDNMGFEISPRNISHDENGNLVMLDCFFDKSALKW